MKRRFSACILMCISLILFDRITKAWAYGYLRLLPGGQAELFPGLLSMQYVENTGAAFGILSGMRLLNSLLTLALLIGLAIFVYRSRNSHGFLFSGAVVMAGGISHLYDRLLGQNIIDFIKLEFIEFPIFNIADICICTGTFLLGVAYLLAEKRHGANKHEDDL